MICYRPHTSVLVFGLSLWLVATAIAQQSPAESQPEVTETAPLELPLRRVAMHASGLGWFHYEGSVAGKNEFRLKIPENQVNDVLRTLHIHDPASQSYATIDAGIDPAQPTPPALDTTTLGDLLLSMKGQSIAVHTRLSDVLEGRVVAVEMHLQPEAEQLIERESLTVLTQSGLQSVLLSDVQRIEPQDQKLQQRLNDALLTATNAGTHRTLIVHFEGDLKRVVSVSVLRPVPMWKAAYIASDAALQMRAVVENTSEEDWLDVDLTLVDGNPITFDMDLRSVARAIRPTVERPRTRPELAPQFAEADLQQTPLPAPPEDLFGDANMMGGMGGMGGGMGGDMGMGMEMGDPFGGPSEVESGLLAYDPHTPALAAQPQSTMDPGHAGESLLIQIPHTTILAGRKAILGAPAIDVQAETLSVYQSQYHPTIPMRSLRLVNESSFRLPPGPVSVFLSRTGFAGEAVLPLLSSGSTRLIGFAMDDGVRVKHSPQEMQTARESLVIEAAQRTIETTTRTTFTDTYIADNRSGSDRDLVIDQPLDATLTVEEHEWEVERTESSVRLQSRIPSGEQETFVVRSWHTQPTRQEFLAVDLEQLRRWIGEDTDAIAESDKKRLAQLLEQRLKLRSHEEALAELKQRMSGIHEEIGRVTKQLSTTLKLSQKPRDLYETKLVELETQRATLVDQYDDLQQQVSEQRKRLSSPVTSTKPKDFDPFG